MYAYIQVQRYTNMYMYMYTYIHLYMYVHMYVYMYMYMLVQLWCHVLFCLGIYSDVCLCLHTRRSCWSENVARARPHSKQKYCITSQHILEYCRIVHNIAEYLCNNLPVYFFCMYVCMPFLVCVCVCMRILLERIRVFFCLSKSNCNVATCPSPFSPGRGKAW